MPPVPRTSHRLRGNGRALELYNKIIIAIPLRIRPLIRAYVLGYASSTAPRLLTLLLTHLSRRRKNIDENPDDCFFPSLLRILKGGLEWQRFPTFCAALVGGSSLLEARDSVRSRCPKRPIVTNLLHI